MTLIDDWKRQFPKLWSVRFSLLAALLSGIEVGLQLYLTGKTPVVALGAGLLSLGAAVARVVAQPGVVTK